MKALDPRLLRHASASRGYLVVAGCIVTASATLLVVQAFAITEVVVRPFQSGASLAGVAGPLVALAAVVLLRSGLAWGAEVAAHRAAADVKSQLRMSLLGSVIRLGPARLQERSAGELAVLATRGTDDLDGYFARYLPALMAACVIPVVVVVVVFTRDPVSAAIILLTLPLIPVFGILIGLATQESTRRQWQALATLGGHFLDLVEGLPTLLLFGRAESQSAAIRRRAEAHRRATMTTLRVAFLSSAVLEFVATISVALVAVSVGLRLDGGSLSLRTALVVLLLAPEAYWPFRQVGLHFHAASDGLAAAEAIFTVLEEEPDAGGPAEAITRAPDLTRSVIRLDGISVRFDRALPALAAMDLQIHPGEHLGITGATGCGKSTLLSVLLGFVTPTSGRVLIEAPDGAVDLAAVDGDAWRSRIAWVPQRPWLATRSIADNVRLARPDADDATVIEALRSAEAYDFVSRLPDGMFTVLGQNGHGLSAGQRQRIALARAFLRNADLVLLDEASAHLDPATESRVAAAVRRLAADHTVISVAHRPALLSDVDRLIVLGERVPV